MFTLPRRLCAAVARHVTARRLSSLPPGLLAAAKTQVVEDTLRVAWKDGSCNRFPLVYLRDNCRCPSCYDPNIKARLTDVLSYSNLEYASTCASADQNQVRIQWPDGHVSTFAADWLQKRRFPEDKAPPTKSIVPDHVALWDSGMKDKVPRMTFEEIIGSDSGVCEWRELLRKYGVVFMTDLPKERGQLSLLAGRVAGYIRATISGSLFEIVINEDSFGLPFTDKEVSPHLDQPFLDNTSDVLMLHCIRQASSGGETMLIDGFSVATQLYEADPKAFRVLTQTCLPYRYMEESPSGKAMVESNKVPIRLDDFGKLRQISYNEHSRATEYRMSVSEVQDFYDAHVKLTKLIRHPSNLLHLKMAPGQGFALDNRRIIHGRKAFDIASGVRSVEGCYLDWDAINSKNRYIVKAKDEQKEAAVSQ